MLKNPNLFIVLNLMIILIFASYVIWQKESTLNSGKLVFLELQPVDPRSLMQGDYMDLRYKLCSEFNVTDQALTGTIVICTNDQSIVQQLVFPSQDTSNKLCHDKLNLKYHIRNSQLRLGAESYFFQEGKANSLDSAKYGGLVIDNNGNSILIGLYDKNLLKL